MNLHKILSRRRLLIIASAGFVLCIALVLLFILLSPLRHGDTATITVDTSALHKQTKISSGFPVRLKIPVLNVDSAIEYVGLTPLGDMDVPENPNNVAWYKLGQRPGENGSAVVAGHSGYKDNIPAVFDNLSKLGNGDKLQVEDEKGTIISFVVRESRSYIPEADASGVFSSNDGKAHLNLITCEGVWNMAQKSYSNRLVVFTDKE